LPFDRIVGPDPSRLQRGGVCAGMPTRPVQVRRPAGKRTVRRSRPRRRAPGEAELPATVSGVLRRLGRALVADDFATAAVCFAYPSLFLTGADTHEFRDPLQVQTVFREGRSRWPAGAVGLGMKVERSASLGHGIYACDVRWAATGERAHCIVQESSVGTALIRALVAVPPDGR
jgi:hypothetical protein